MSLQSILKISADKSAEGVLKEGISEERLRECLDELRRKIAFYREYPDIFIDEIKGPDSVFNFRFSQRVFLRAVMRHRYVYAVFPRGFSKSFLTVMALMLRAVLFPGSNLFVTTGGKEQAAAITLSKVQEICKLLPTLANEIDWSRGETIKSRLAPVFAFKNGSRITILAASDSSRGQRMTGGAIEEAILIDGRILNEVIIPTTNVDRLLADGSFDHDEAVNQSQVYITTAGWKNSFPYKKFVELFINSIMFPDKYMVMSGGYELSIIEGAVKEDMIKTMKLNGTYDESSFDREYRSIWSGDAENAFYTSDGFDKCRQLLQPEKEWSGRTKTGYYAMGIDVGRFKCTTEVCIFKVTPQPQASAIKSLVNLYTYEAENFETQALNIKKLYYKYKCKCIAIDANGVGAGFVDFMTVSQTDEETGDVYPPFGVAGGNNVDVMENYKQINKTPGIEKDAMYLIKANAPLNTECYSYVKTQMSSGRIKLLIDERTASTKLMETKVGQMMTPDERAAYLVPFNETTFLKNQMLNLVENNDGINILLKRNNNNIGKDKFSAFMYGLYYIKQEEDKRNKRKTRDITDFMFFS